MSNGSPPIPAAAAGFAPGRQISGYRLEEQIGRGGMAVVFRAHDERLNRQVALKILAPVLAEDEGFRQRFIQESQAAAAVDDPNIIPVYEAGEADGVLFIATRLVKGGDLRTLVAQHGPLSPGRAEWILSAVASALDAAHAAGLVHRDVKPANMLLEVRAGRPDHVYLSDFGVSKAALGSSGLTASGQFLGTVDYAAPEQIQGRLVDGRTDQYALGCSAYELLCGRPPFFGRQWLAAMYAQLSEPPALATSLRNELPAAVNSVFARVLAKSCDDRYPTCRDFVSALGAALGVQSYTVETPTARRDGVDTDAAQGDDATLHPPPRSAPTGNGSGQDALAGTDPSATMHVTSGRRVPAVSARRRKIALAAAATVILAVAAVAGLLAARSPALAAPYVFKIRTFEHGLTLSQRWKLAGPNGTTLQVSITASNATSSPVSVQLEEPIPAAVASRLQAVRFDPPARLLTANRVAVWHLRLPARGHAVVGYQVIESPAGATEARLTRWLRAFTAVASEQTLEPITSGGILQSLTISPKSLGIYVDRTFRLRLQGSLSDGKSAPGTALARASWTSSNAGIVTVSSSGDVFGVSPGAATVTVRVGLISASAVVQVVGARSGGGQPSPSPSPSASESGSPSPSPSASESGSPSPSPSASVSGSPSPGSEANSLPMTNVQAITEPGH